MTKHQTDFQSKRLAELDDLTQLNMMSMAKLFFKYPEARSLCKSIRHSAAFESWVR